MLAIAIYWGKHLVKNFYIEKMPRLLPVLQLYYGLSDFLFSAHMIWQVGHHTTQVRLATNTYGYITCSHTYTPQKSLQNTTTPTITSITPYQQSCDAHSTAFPSLLFRNNKMLSINLGSVLSILLISHCNQVA